MTTDSDAFMPRPPCAIQVAIQAVGKWTFRPGRKGGRAVNTRMQVPIVFSLNDR